MWAKFENGLIYNFTSDLYKWVELGCFATNIKGFGFENKQTIEVCGTDFISTEVEAVSIPITMDLYLTDQDRVREFDSLFNGKLVKLYYDGSGFIDPQDQLSKCWYRECELVKIDKSEQLSNGFYLLSVTFNPKSSKAKRDVFSSSTVEGVVGNDLQYPFYYPYFYSSGQQLISEIVNEGNRVGVVITIKNTGSTSLEKVNFYVDSANNVRQYASWLYDAVKLEAGRTLIIDSRPRTQKAKVYYETNESDVLNYRHPNPQYINFVSLYNGNNKFVFDFGRTSDIEVTIEIQEESGVL